MCGIAGYYLFKKNYTEIPLVEMIKPISHRGPDAECFFEEKNVGLAHCRLSIIDLSASANQPMVSQDQQWVLAFNGELYNYKEIAKQLPIVLKTHSDAEVMLEAFAHRGVQTVQTFNGMFAIALFDREENSLFLVRDRLGVKPLFYLQNEEGFFFASEIKSLLRILTNEEKKSFDENALQLFLHLGFIPGPFTAWKKIKKFPAGSFVKINTKEIVWQRYWSAQSTIKSHVAGNQVSAEKELIEKLDSAVSLRMISDVPFGVFLSGGIDSSLVTALAQKQSAAPLKTFSVAFKENAFDESKFAEEVSACLKTDHRQFLLTEQDAQEQILESIDIFDEPFADSSALPFMLLSKFARREVKMVLTGDGGDELFMGYNRYYIAALLSNSFVNKWRLPAAQLLKFGNEKWKRAASIFDHEAENSHPHLLSQAQQFYSSVEVKKLFRRNHAASLQYQTSRLRKLSPAEEQSLFEMEYYLRDDLLVKADRAGMHVALECRSPFLDYQMVDFALNLDEHLKRRGRNGKLILKTLLRRHLPETLFNRPKKGFGIPLAKWLRGDLQFLTDKYFSQEFLLQYPLLDGSLLVETRNRFLRGDASLYHKVWTIIVLHRWMERNL